MTCRCGQYFCWLCGAPTGFAHDWTKIENHECGRYKEDTDKAATAAQNSLQRYMFYYERFSAHDSTRQMVKQMEDLLEQRRRDIRAKGIEPGHFITILEDAHVVIVKARRMLAWSYVYAFYMFSGATPGKVAEEMRTTHKNLFEDFQTQLEGSLEILSKLTQTLPVDDTVWRHFERMANMTKIVAKKLNGLSDVIQNHILEQGSYGVVAAVVGVRVRC
eukprot:TRINITY_DN2594_c0_g1_i7.p2 TRINITY_DN2594_c0_g1~~TRINITY_DN2594_c0_g1_i7.p2  ORF type:complete len:218 (-),score=55.03 TRINITY_DN2594_c0_g1_i7:113-766(-)